MAVNKTMTFPRLTDLRKAVFFAVCGGVGGAAGALLAEPMGGGPSVDFAEAMANVAVWFGLIGAAIAAAILFGQGWYLRRKLRPDRSVMLGAVFGLIAGALSGAIAQFIFSAGGEGEVLRAFCWGIAGGLLGLILSARIPNLAWRRGLSGGLLGGLAGGILFIALSAAAGDTLGRLTGVFAIGFLIGLMIMLADALFREAWLEIAYGSREKRSISLGAEAVTFGSDPGCTVYVAGVAPRACSYKLEQGRIIYEDLATGQTSAASPGDSLSLGKLTVTVHGASPQPASPSGSGAPARPVAGWRAPGGGAASPTAPSPSVLALWLSSSQQIPLVLGATVNRSDLPRRARSGLKDEALAVVASNPSDPSITGLKNLSSLTWQVSLPSGVTRNVEPGQTIRLAAGTGIDFGAVRAEVR